MRRFAPRLSQVRWLDVYVGGIVALGGAVAALAIVTGVPTVPAWQVVLLAVCCGATQLVRTSLPRSSSVSPAVVISFAALVWLRPGGGAAAVAAQIGGLPALVATATLGLLPWMSIQLYASKARQAAAAIPMLGISGQRPDAPTGERPLPVRC